MFILTSQLRDKNADICIDSYPFLIGRNEHYFEKIQIHFPHVADLISFLSKQHASLDLDDRQLTIVDLGSINGTKVNGHPVGNQKVVLQHGDRVSFAEQLHYTLVDTDHNEVKEGPLLTLEPVDKELGLSTISIEDSSFIIGRNIPAFSSTPEHLINETQNISRQHCKLQWQNDTFYITDLGSTNGTRVNDILLGANESTALQNGMRVIFSPLLAYEVRIASSIDKELEHKDKTQILSIDKEGLIDSSVEEKKDLNEHTVYMKDATSFLSFLADESSQDSVNTEDNGEKSKKLNVAIRKYWTNKVATRTLSVSIVVVAIISIGYYLYNQSSNRQLHVLFKSGQYKQAALQAQEILSAKPGHREAEELLFQSITKEYLVDWATAVLNKQPERARDLLIESQNFAEVNQEITSLLRLLLLLTDLIEKIPDTHLDQLTIDINLTGHYSNIFREWNQSKLANRAFLDRLLQVDDVFTEIQESVFRKLNSLEILVSQHLKGVESLQKDIGFYLMSSQPEQITALLDSFSQKYPNVRGIESFRFDLKAYLEIMDLIQRHDSIALLEKTSSFQPTTSPFREHLPNLLLMVPNREDLQTFTEGEFAWQQGDVDHAVTLLEQVATGTWSEYAQNRIDHFRLINDLYSQLDDDPTAQYYFIKMRKLQEILEEGDGYFKSSLAEKLSETSRLQKVNLDIFTKKSIEHWKEYINFGGISASMRMEPAVSEGFRRQAMHLSKAYDFSQEASQLIRVYGLSSEAEFNNHARTLQNEVLIQQKRMQSLRNIISKDIFYEKISLLPKG